MTGMTEDEATDTIMAGVALKCSGDLLNTVDRLVNHTTKQEISNKYLNRTQRWRGPVYATMEAVGYLSSAKFITLLMKSR